MWVVVYCKSFVSAFIMNRNLSEHLTQCTVFCDSPHYCPLCRHHSACYHTESGVTPCTYKVKALAKGKVHKMYTKHWANFFFILFCFLMTASNSHTISRMSPPTKLSLCITIIHSAISVHIEKVCNVNIVYILPVGE